MKTFHAFKLSMGVLGIAIVLLFTTAAWTSVNQAGFQVGMARVPMLAVTNTNDSGPGSLRAASQTANEARVGTILFEVDGAIVLQSTLPIALEASYAPLMTIIHQPDDYYYWKGLPRWFMMLTVGGYFLGNRSFTV